MVKGLHDGQAIDLGTGQPLEIASGSIDTEDGQWSFAGVDGEVDYVSMVIDGSR